MKKVKRLIEIKRQQKLAEAKLQRAQVKQRQLKDERDKILDAITQDEWRLYKEQIERACKL